MSRRPITVVIFSGFFLLGMLFLMWGILLPDIAANLQMSKMVSGALFLLFSMGMMIGAIVGGKYVSKFDFLSLLALLISVNAVLLLIVSVLSQWQWVLFAVFTVGVVSSSIITIGHTLIAQLYAEKRFAMMGVMDFMFSLGTFAASFYVTFIYSFENSWRWPLRVLTVLLLVLAAYTFLAAAKNKRLAPVKSGQPKRSLAYGGIIRQPVFLMLALVSFGYGAVEFGNANWFVSYAQQTMSYSGEDARNLLAFFTAGMVISRLCFAFLLRWFTTHRLTVILATMTFFGALAIKLADSFYFIGIGNLILGLGLGGLFPLILSAAMSIDADKGPVLSGISIIGNSLGVQLASFSTGVWANFASLGEAFWVIPMAGAWLWLTAWYYSRELKRRHVDHVDPAAL
ncbi:MFS transporter [Alteromonas pelagimontana]|uniref:MFS transporter n=1 Tax=Alteromonas pelagimontana TaxID=1858656 RepID=A0A6M4MC81_9ALTE|nr:MFS transporter [Alteromonas pelagimontana]QJR80804.1 MFS transporter [Alteromonas pelagimontana]